MPLLGAFAPESGSFEALVLMLAAALVGAKLLGELCERWRQPAVLGEMVAGVLLGPSVAGLVDPNHPSLHAMAEIGVMILLFHIGLETQLRKLAQVGSAATVVALVGVAVPLGLGFGVAELFGLAQLPALVIGAALTATSVGITARVLADLGRLQDPESQVVLGAAVLDDVIGLIILAVVTAIVAGGTVTAVEVGGITLVAFGFIGAALVLGRLVVPPLFDRLARFAKESSLAMIALMTAFALAVLAQRAGSALIIGAFTAGLVFASTPYAKRIDDGVSRVGQFFVPLFFVSVGASVNVRTLGDSQVLQLGALLCVVAILGKVVAGFAPWWFRGNKLAIGVGMVPRGEVGLIFAQMGLTSGVLDDRLFAALAMMVLVTTFLPPLVLKRLLGEGKGEKGEDAGGAAELVTEI